MGIQVLSSELKVKSGTTIGLLGPDLLKLEIGPFTAKETGSQWSLFLWLLKSKQRLSLIFT